jgi:type 1 fimbria pilin
MKPNLISLFKPLLVTMAACMPGCAFAIYNDCTAALPLSVSIPAVSVPTSLPVGQPIPGATASFVIPINCTVSTSANWYMTAVSSGAINLVPGFSDVYTTAGIGGGIGFRIRSPSGEVMAPLSYAGAVGTFNMAPQQVGSNTVSGVFELVKTGAATAGTFGYSSYVHVPNKEYANGGTAAASTVSLGYTLLPATVASCSVTTTSVAVSLPTVSTSAFQAIGTHAGVTAFSIGLNCEANAKPSIYMTDSASPSNTTNQLSLAPGSTASGIAVQILYQQVPVSFAPAALAYTTSNTPTTSSFSIGNLSGTSIVQMQARYTKTQAVVTPGTVKAIATFTLTYQ